MESIRIYLAGGMSGLTFEDQVKWRSKVRDAILYGGYDYECKPHFFSPPEYYPIDEPVHKSEREAMEFDLNALRKSDLVVVNFNAPNSLGTMAELAIAYENRIPIIALNIDGVELHPWAVEFCTRICDDMYELVDHISSHYLNF